MIRMLSGLLVALALVFGVTAKAGAQDLYNCADFATKDDAQRTYDFDPSDPNGLDGPVGPDNDTRGTPGDACEEGVGGGPITFEIATGQTSDSGDTSGDTGSGDTSGGTTGGSTSGDTGSGDTSGDTGSGDTSGDTTGGSTSGGSTTGTTLPSTGAGITQTSGSSSLTFGLLVAAGIFGAAGLRARRA